MFAPSLDRVKLPILDDEPYPRDLGCIQAPPVYEVVDPLPGNPQFLRCVGRFKIHGADYRLNELHYVNRVGKIYFFVIPLTPRKRKAYYSPIPLN
jgi:hypothetical protein